MTVRDKTGTAGRGTPRSPPSEEDWKVKVTAADTTPNFLFPKLAAGTNITLTVLNPGANEQVEIAAVGPFPVAAHAPTHRPATGTDPLATAAGPIGIGGGNAAGVGDSFSRNDHDHALRETGGPTDLTIGAVPANGVLFRSAATLIGSAAPVSVGQALIWGGAVWAPSVDFGALNPVTTGGWLANSATGFIRLGLAPGSGAGVASAASVGNIRAARGATGFEMWGRNNADTADLLLQQYNSTATRFTLGSSTLSNIRIISSTEVETIIGASTIVSVTVTSVQIGVAPTLQFGSGVVAPFIRQAPENTAGATADPLTIHAQDMTGTGAGTAGALTVRAGDTTNAGTTMTAGKHTSRAGDATNGTVANIGGDYLLRAGRGSGAGAVDGNIAIHADPASYQSMQRGIFIGDRTAAPTGNPAAGGFLYVTAGALTWRGSGGTTTVIAAA